MVISVKKFEFSTYDVYLEIHRIEEDGKTKYSYTRFAQKHPIKKRTVPPYAQVNSEPFSTVWEAVVSGYNSVEVFPINSKN